MKLISSEVKYSNSLFTLSEDVAVDPDGFEIKRAILHHNGSAVIMPVDEKGRILLVRQYRLAAQSYLWELPAGKVDEGETPLQGAKRELKEETGYKAKSWLKLVSYWASPGFVAEKMNLFVARELTAGAAQPMEDERITIQWFSSAQLKKLILAGEIHDGKTILGFLLWNAHKAKLRSPQRGQK